MKTKHTQGQWNIKKSTNGEIKVGLGSNIHNFNICQLNTASKESEANAKLIAAAPDLLDEHIMDLNHLETWKSKLIDAGLRGSVLFQEYLDMIEHKRKVIEKATK